jgi:hypothetical protein
VRLYKRYPIFSRNTILNPGNGYPGGPDPAKTGIVKNHPEARAVSVHEADNRYNPPAGILMIFRGYY